MSYRLHNDLWSLERLRSVVSDLREGRGHQDSHSAPPLLHGHGPAIFEASGLREDHDACACPTLHDLNEILLPRRVRVTGVVGPGVEGSAEGFGAGVNHGISDLEVG